MLSDYTVAVRTLCEFTAKVGDLDLRFTPSPTAQQGMDGHAEVTARRTANDQHYQREMTLSGSYQHLRVRGRADGYDPQLNRLEEIKTHRGDLARLPDNHRQLHWAQARVYAWLMCQQLGKRDMQVALVYFDITRQTEMVLVEHHSAADLQLFFEGLCQRFLGWADQETAHRLARDEALLSMPFPHEEFRVGQRYLSESVYKANLSRRCLLAQAPTGIGKTMGTVFPVLKAMPGQRLDKLFFLTAKTPGRQLALDALQALKLPMGQRSLRVLELVARDKACEHPDKACHGDSCPLAQGFYDRLPQARQAAVERAFSTGNLGKDVLRTLALQHRVCPYYLGQELVRWSDVVVGDYNHFFDLSAMLFGLTVADEWRVSVLLDEAHNLVERARQMYTGTLALASFHTLKHTAPQVLKKSFDRLSRQWNAMVKISTEAATQHIAYRVMESLPDKLLLALQKLSADITEFFASNPTHADPQLQRFYFDALLFLRLAELHGPHSMVDLSLDTPQGDVLCIRNVVPGPHLKDRWKAAHSVTLFSATLKPQRYLMDMLGLPETTACIDVPTTFSAQQLTVRIATQISTRYRDRQGSLTRLAGLMARQLDQTPGNYLAFFSSFDYLQMAVDQLQATRPDITLWQQSRRMGEPERDAFLARFTPTSQGIGFAVLGGVFGEGIDLPGARLIGAFIATLGLPQINPVNEEIRKRLQTLMEEGYDYTYLYPGIQKVVQAAGRVIRTPQDQGVVVLMDDRFAQAKVRKLLPDWWRVLS
jgi:DNA excision repair protein ERCC-2